ncbi:hypothetical protein NFJ02_23g51420 [Pycnococcus provasolii]
MPVTMTPPLKLSCRFSPCSLVANAPTSRRRGHASRRAVLTC